jgi:hypothetical protein
MWNDFLDFVATLFGVLVILIIMSTISTLFGVIGYSFYHLVKWVITFIG